MLCKPWQCICTAAVCSRCSLRGLIALIRSPVCLYDTKFPWQQRETCHFLGKWPTGLVVPSCSVLFFVASPATRSNGNNKSTSDNGAPKQRSWNAVTTGWPPALFTLQTLMFSGFFYMHTASSLPPWLCEIIWLCSEQTFSIMVSFMRSLNCGCWLWHVSRMQVNDIHHILTSCYSAPVTVMSLQYHCNLLN